MLADPDGSIRYVKERDALVEAWSRAASQLGAYFWLHGKPVPKFYPRRFAEYLRFLRKHKVDAVYAVARQIFEHVVDAARRPTDRSKRSGTSSVPTRSAGANRPAL